MDKSSVNRRSFVRAGLAASGTLLLPFSPSLWAGGGVATAAVETTSGHVRGQRVSGVSRFLGIRYGADTGLRRFRSPEPPMPWRGVHDCVSYGAQAPQGMVGLPGARVKQAPPPGPPKAIGAVMAIASQSMSAGPQSEDCLFLNVYTPDASAARKRPVMVWLHGGGFAMGSGGIPSTDGDDLARFGDVVVVSLNHRLNALGYLYLGDLHDDFADSGNAGHLDIVLALKWVRENIANFGGDPGNVTIFGQSGGGAKVGAMMGMVPGKGLFHKAIEQSGPYVRGVERSDAAELADRTLKNLGIAASDVHKLSGMKTADIISAATQAQGGGFGSGRSLAPVVDGRNLPAHPFDPTASEISRNVPLVVGCTKDESTMFLAGDPAFGYLTAEQVRERFHAEAGERGEEAFKLYSSRRPDDAPTYWLSSYQTDAFAWSGSLRTAERKSEQKGAAAYLYRVDWHTVLQDGILRATHGADMPFVFRHLDGFGAMNGDGPAQRRLMDVMSQAWVNFARSGNPSQQGLHWQAYDTGNRMTMLFDTESRAVSDPDTDIRKYWATV